MTTMDLVFKPGMLVAYGEIRNGHMHHVIVLRQVKTVGKRFVLLHGSADRYRLTGQCTSSTYRDRGVLPLTRALLAQAEQDKACDLGLALGYVLPD